MPKSTEKETYLVFDKPCKSFKEAAQRAVDAALESRESVAISCLVSGKLEAYVIVTASLEHP